MWSFLFCIKNLSFKIAIFSWVVEFLENILALSLKQDLMYSHQSLAEKRLLNPRSRPEGSYKIGSVCSSFHPSFRLSVHFLGIGSLVFPVRSPYIVVCDISHLWKWAILGPKIAHPLNSGSAGRSFFKFCKMKWANR